MRIVFAGTPEAAVPALTSLAESGHEILLVITRRDAPLGRKRTLTPSPVAAAADELHLPVHKTDRLDAHTTALVTSLSPELGVIVAYGGLVREPLLSVPPSGWVNLHFSLLPRWRGAAPVQRAIMAGDAETGAGVFQLTAGMDEGDIFDEVRMPLTGEETAGEVLAELAGSGARLLTDVVARIAVGTARARPQAGGATTAAKLTDEDGRVRWELPGPAVRAQILGTTPDPGAFAEIGGTRVKILAIAAAALDAPTLDPGVVTTHGRAVVVGTATTPVELRTVQPAGKNPMSAADWWRGLRVDRLCLDLPAESVS